MTLAALLAWDLLFAVYDTLPATVPVAFVVIAASAPSVLRTSRAAQRT